jgi:hypothetical protein
VVDGEHNGMAVLRLDDSRQAVLHSPVHSTLLYLSTLQSVRGDAQSSKAVA